MDDEQKPPSHCEICGRGLLPGERAVVYVSPDGRESPICELCKPRAEAAGWLRPEDVLRREEQGEPGRERRPRGQSLGSLLGTKRGPRERERPQRSAGRAGASQRPSRTGRTAPGAPAFMGSGVGVTVPQALEVFNASEHRRTVAGLSRSLGEPRASGLAIRIEGGSTGARITVAWELAWYQWEIGPGDRGVIVRESGKGETVEQLRAADRTWNLFVSSDGSLSKHSSEPSELDAESGQPDE